MHARSAWGVLGTLRLREGVDPRLAAIFYRAVVQTILLYGSETWVILEAMKKKVEGAHTDFLRQMTGNLARQIVDGTWETPRAEVVREATGTKLEPI